MTSVCPLGSRAASIRSIPVARVTLCELGIPRGDPTDCGGRTVTVDVCDDKRHDHGARSSGVLFPTHLVVAVGLASGRFPTAWAVAGAVVPDLIDKPLGAAGVFATYHSLGHSALLGVAFLVPLFLARRAGWRVGAERLAAAALGWGSHLAADAVHVVINGRPADAVFLVWPLVREWDAFGLGPVAFAVQYVGTPSFYLEILIWLVVGVVLLRDRRDAADGSSPRLGE